MKKALIIIDMQNDFITGSLGTKEAEEIVPVVKGLIEKGGYDGLYFTKDTHSDNYMDTQEGKMLPVLHCIVGTDGWNIHKDLPVSAANAIICKNTFGYHAWDEHLKDYDEITLVGLCTDICVITNALVIKTLYPEMIVNIVANATAGVTPEKKESALETARSCQINVI